MPLRGDVETGEVMTTRQTHLQHLSVTKRNRILLVVNGVIQWVYGWTIGFNPQTEQFLVCWDDLSYGLGKRGLYFPEQLYPSSLLSEMPA